MPESTEQKQDKQERFGKKLDRRGRPHDWDFKNQLPVCKIVSMPDAPQSAQEKMSAPQGVMKKQESDEKPVKRRQGRKAPAASK